MPPIDTPEKTELPGSVTIKINDFAPPQAIVTDDIKQPSPTSIASKTWKSMTQANIDAAGEAMLSMRQQRYQMSPERTVTEQWDGEDGDAEIAISERQPIEPRDAEDDYASVISLYASISSVQSVASTADEITTATRKVAQLFHREDSQASLYVFALRDPAIGPAKLKRNLRRLLRQYAEDLKEEASDQSEYLGARLVWHQASLLAEMIISRFGESLPVVITHTTTKDESSDDEDSTKAFGESVFADIRAFITFLESSVALGKFQERLERFVSLDRANEDYMPKLIMETTRLPDDQPVTVSERSDIAEALHDEAEGRESRPVGIEGEEDIELVEFGFPRRESSDQPQKKHFNRQGYQKRFEALPIVQRVQFRWQCRCTKTFVSDVFELRENGIVDLKGRMEQYIGSRVTVTQASGSTNPSRAKTMYQRLDSLFRSAFSELASRFKNQNAGLLPLHSNGAVATTTPLPPGNTAQQRMLHLLACMHVNRVRKLLSQDRVESVTCDRTLFTFMRDKHSRRRVRARLVPSLNEVRRIFFVKFRLPLGGSVEVRHHNPCCQPSSCECIPPKDRVEPATQAEYRCIPGPPSVWPPVDPQYLAHLFNDPSCANENDTWILDQLPRRICGELQGKAGKPAEGWGIYYEEGLNWRLITLIMVVVFILVSLFGILWAYYKQDIQGAFGVSSYLFAACGIFLSLLAVNSDKV